MTLFSGEKLRLARVLHEDSGFITLEVAKSIDAPLQVNDGDRFLTVLFIRAHPNDPTHPVEVVIPWEEPNDG